MPQDKVMIGLVSDTHGWLDPELLELFQGAALIVHAGDVGEPAVLEQLAQVAPLLAVRGNIDGGELADLPLRAMETLAGQRVAALHIAGPPRRPNKAASALLREWEPQVLVVGHSHIPVVQRVRGALWINPGAAGHQGFHQERFAARLYLGGEGGPGLERLALGPRGAKARR